MGVDVMRLLIAVGAQLHVSAKGNKVASSLHRVHILVLAGARLNMQDLNFLSRLSHSSKCPRSALCDGRTGWLTSLVLLDYQNALRSTFHGKRGKRSFVIPSWDEAEHASCGGHRSHRCLPRVHCSRMLQGPLWYSQRHQRQLLSAILRVSFPHSVNFHRVQSGKTTMFLVVPPLIIKIIFADWPP